MRERDRERERERVRERDRQREKARLRAQQPYLYSDLLRRSPHCQAHKRFIEQGNARSWRGKKIGQEV